MDIKKIGRDVNGNPRYVVHFLNFITDKDEKQVRQDFAASLARNPFRLTEFLYDLALERGRKIGGRKYNYKSFGGGIVFQSYNVDDLKKSILELTN